VDALSMKGGTGDHSYATNSHYQVFKHWRMWWYNNYVLF